MSSKSEPVEYTRNIIIRSISFIFLVTFVNIYSQTEFLWSKSGLAPVDHLIEIHKNSANYEKTFFPSIIPFLHNTFGIKSESIIYIMSAIGSIISLLMVYNKKYHKSFLMFIIWYFYLNIFIVGQQFMSYEFDYFNLEIGFISIFLCDFTFINTKTKYLQTISKYLLKFAIFKILFSYGLSLIFSNNKPINRFQEYESFLIKQYMPSSLILTFLKHIPDQFQSLLSCLMISVLLIAPFGMFCFFKRINRISGILIAIFSLSMSLIGNFGLSNLMLFGINFVNFDDEFIDFLLNGEKKKNLPDGREYIEASSEELITTISIDILFLFFYVIFTILLIFPLNKALDGQFELIPNSEKNPYRFFTMRHLKAILILIAIYLICMSIIDYYKNYLKKDEEFKNVKNFKDLKENLNFKIIFKFIGMSLIVIVYLFHSVDMFYSGINTPMIIKRKNSLLYTFSDRLYNMLHHFNIASGYALPAELLEETHIGRDVLVFKYLVNKTVYEKEEEPLNITSLDNNSTKNNTNSTDKKSINLNNSTNNETNNTNNNNTKRYKMKEKIKQEWKIINFENQIDENLPKYNLRFLMLLLRQPRFEFSLYRLAFQKREKLNNLYDNVLLTNLLYRLFADKNFNETVLKIKVDKYKYYYSSYSTKPFRASKISEFFPETNLSSIELYLHNLNSSLLNKDVNKNILQKIPLANIIITIIFVLFIKELLMKQALENKEKENAELNKEK